MEQIRIVGVRTIAKDKQGKAINLVVIDLANGKPSIVRTNVQFITDLQNSYLIGDDVQVIQHPDVRDVLRDLASGSLSGNISYHKAGEDYTITENSSAVTNPNHPDYGDVQVGDKAKYKSDLTRVDDGFLNLRINLQADVANKQAKAVARATMAMQGAFDAFNFSTESNESTTDVDLDDLPEDLVTEAMSASED